MPVYSFPCPHCAAPLRLQDRRYVGRVIDCPDCHRAVELIGDRRAGVTARRATSPARQTADGISPSASDTGDDSRSVTSGLRQVWRRVTSPLGVAWSVAILLTVGLMSVLARSPHPENVPGSSSAPIERHVAAEHSLLQDAQRPDAVQGRMNRLFDELWSYRDQTGSFPAGAAGDASLPDHSRWSWLAVLAPQSDPHGLQPNWDRAWNDPLNDRFVRQRQERYLNPRIARQTGDDRYPASHFVGVTGIGRDSAELPADHPRAGIFGLRRATHIDDVGDGLANTVLVAGVEKHLGSWAAAGRSTLRGFTSEPYVGGPDGFGTGQAEGMSVLMADGSVRFLSAQTDPAVIRGLAAKADASPPDVSPPGEVSRAERPDEGDRAVSDDAAIGNRPAAADSSRAPKKPLQAAVEIMTDVAGDDERPIEVPLVEEPPPVDPAGRLTQPIARFAQSTPAPARRVLQTVEEMAATEFDFDQLPDHVLLQLDQPVRLTLTDTTVGEILAEVLGQIGLTYQTEAGRVVLHVQPDEKE